MKKTIILYSFLLVAVMIPFSLQCCFAQPQTPEFLWTNRMQVNDVAVSKDGNYIAAVNDTGLYYFASSSSVPIWWCEPSADYPVISVVISSNGEYVAFGTDNVGYICYFRNSRSRVNLQNPTWSSQPFPDAVTRGTFDMSDNGDYVAVGGSGESIYYFADCMTRSGSGQTSTWSNLLSGLINSVDLSSDGRYVALGGMRIAGGGFVAFYKNAFSSPYPTEPLWWSEDVWDVALDVALSDDGFAVTAVTSSSSLHYWKNAATLSGNPSANWDYGVPLYRVDASTNGDRIVAFSGQIGSLYFWANSRQRIDGTRDWIRLESETVYDAAISDDGSIIAAVTGNASGYWAYFYAYDGNLLGNAFQLDALSDKISMSADGTTVAVGGAPKSPDSLYVFETESTVTPLPVGGEIQPSNTLELIVHHVQLVAPYLLASMLAVATLITVLARTRQR